MLVLFPILPFSWQPSLNLKKMTLKAGGINVQKKCYETGDCTEERRMGEIVPFCFVPADYLAVGESCCWKRQEELFCPVLSILRQPPMLSVFFGAAREM